MPGLKSNALNFLSLFLCIVLLTGCDKSPPSPMPYTTTENEVISLIKADYSVSRFWACGWTDSCPLKRWDYCLLVVPQNEEAALKWYRIYHHDNFQRAGWELAERKDKNIDSSSSINLPSKAESSHPSSLSYAQQAQLTLERFVEELQLIQNNDPAFKQKVFTEMQEGIRITAWTSIRKAGTEEESITRWQLASYCLL